MEDSREDTLVEEFTELLKVEEESQRYLKQLDSEEGELRKAVDRAVSEDHAIRLLESSLTAKIGAQRQAREQMGVASLQKRNSEMKNEVLIVGQEADSIRMETLRKGTKVMAIHVEETNKLQNRFKEFRNPKAVMNAVNTKKVQISQIKSQIHADLDKLGRIKDEVSRLEGQREKFKVFHEVVMDSKEVVKQGAEKQSV